MRIIFLAISIVYLASCADKAELPVSPKPGLLQVPEGFPGMPFPEDNQFTEERWQLGKRLFYDPVLSIDSQVSCGSCHQQSLGFADDVALSPGAFGRPGVRNAPTLANVGYHPYFLTEGGVPTLEMQVLVPVQEHNEFAHNIVEIAKLLQKDSAYTKMSKAAYGREPDPFVITRAISTFERTLISGNSAYDKYHYQGKTSALTPVEKRGMELFFSSKTNCSSCHSGFNFTDFSFANNGLDTAYSDIGRMRVTGNPEDRALFKVPTLRNIALSAPYMHDGRFATLEEVVGHYNSGGKAHPNKSGLIRPLHLTSKEKGELAAFLNSLTDWEFVSDGRFGP